MDDKAFEKMIVRDEDDWLKPYLDVDGNWTIGKGRNLSERGIRQIESDFMFSNDVADIKAELNRAIPWWAGLSDNRQMVLASMAYNMGTPRLMGFRKMLTAAKAGSFQKAAAEILDSKAARKLPARYQRLADLMREG